MSALVTIEITVDLIPKPNTVKIRASQYDNNSRLVIVNITRGGEAFDLSDVGEVRVEGTRTDGVAFVSYCTVSESQATFYITKEMTGCAGKHPAEIVLYDNDGERLGSMNFSIQVEGAAMDEDASVTPEDETILQQYIDTMGEVTVNNADGGTFADWEV